MPPESVSLQITNADLQALEPCEVYPIRDIGHIQPHGSLLVLQWPELTVVQASQNIEAMLGLAVDQLLEQPLVHNPVAQDYLAAISSSGKTLLALINDILDLSKIEAGQMPIRYEPTQLSKIVTDIQTIFKQKALAKGLKLRTIYSESIPEVLLLDEVRLRQILFNLVGNALKFTDQGRVDIEVDCTPTRQQDGLDTVELSLSVTDTGMGIPAENQHQGQKRHRLVVACPLPESFQPTSWRHSTSNSKP
jgi:signal transduction histidine kinase